MALQPRSFDDLLLDNMVTAISVYEAEQKLLNATVGFEVDRDRELPMGMIRLPLVNLWVSSIQTQSGGTRSYSPERVVVAVDCYARGLVQGDSGGDTRPASRRLYYLREQVKAALYRLINADYGFVKGVIGHKGWPSWQPFKAESGIPETVVVGGRWTIEIDYHWQPDDIAGVPLDKIVVDSTLWGGIYEY